MMAIRPRVSSKTWSWVEDIVTVGGEKNIGGKSGEEGRNQWIGFLSVDWR